MKISTHLSHLEETLTSLKWATRAKQVTNDVKRRPKGKPLFSWLSVRFLTGKLLDCLISNIHRFVADLSNLTINIILADLKPQLICGDLKEP